VTGVCRDLGIYAQYTTDGDHYLEDFDTGRNRDIAEVIHLERQGVVPAGVRRNEIYPFRRDVALPDMFALLAEGKRMVDEHDLRAGLAPLVPLAAAPAGGVVAAGPPPIAVLPPALALAPPGLGGRPPAGGFAAPGAAAAAPPLWLGGGVAAPPPVVAAGDPLGVGARALMHGPAAAAAPPDALAPGHVWVIAENRGGFEKGQQLAFLPHGSVQHGDRAIVVGAEGASVSVVSMLPSAVFEFLSGDARTLPVKFDTQGTRRRPFAEAVSLMSEDELSGGWPLLGPRATMGTLKAIVDSGGSPEVEHDAWVRTARVPDGDRSVYEDEVISVVLQLLSTVDQVNLPNLAGVELLVRRRALIREAHRLNPASPDYTGAHHFMGWQRRREAGATFGGLTQYVASAMRDEAAIAKETRKAREERQLGRPKANPKKGDAKGGGNVA